MPIRFDLAIDAGADYQVTYPVLDGPGNPVTVTGWTARAQVRRRPLDPAVLQEWTVGAGLTVAGTTVVLFVPAAQSSAWAWTAGVYGLKLIDPGGGVSLLAQGRVTVTPNITR